MIFAIFITPFESRSNCNQNKKHLEYHTGIRGEDESPHGSTRAINSLLFSCAPWRVGGTRSGLLTVLSPYDGSLNKSFSAWLVPLMAILSQRRRNVKGMLKIED
jgi:hypothetical protein